MGGTYTKVYSSQSRVYSFNLGIIRYRQGASSKLSRQCAQLPIREFTQQNGVAKVRVVVELRVCEHCSASSSPGHFPHKSFAVDQRSQPRRKSRMYFAGRWFGRNLRRVFNLLQVLVKGEVQPKVSRCVEVGRLPPYQAL